MLEQVLELQTLAIHDATGAVTVFEQPVIEKAEIAADVAMAGSQLALKLGWHWLKMALLFVLFWIYPGQLGWTSWNQIQ